MAKDHNCLSIIGRLTADAAIHYTASGMAIGSFSIAVNRRAKSGDQYIDETNFFRITTFGKTAENTTQHLTKGKQVAIDGELKQDRWTDQNTGQNRSSVSIIANNVQFLRNPGDTQGQNVQPGGYQQGSQPQGNGYQAPQGGQGTPGASQGYRQPPASGQGYQTQPQGQPGGYQQNPQQGGGYRQHPPTGQGQGAPGPYNGAPADAVADFEDDIPF